MEKKLRHICNRYICIRVPYKFRITADKLSRNSSIKVLKQDKGKEVVMIDRKTYTEEYLSLLHTNSFIQLDHDLTKVTEEKIQKSILKIKKNLTKQECNRLYPTGSSPEKFYGTTKQHKLRKVTLSTISILKQLFLMLELHHINWLNT